jgi:hypothetical protein
MKNYTKIPNELMSQSQLSIQARYLLCVLLKYCGKDEWCFPSQARLAEDLGYKSSRYIRSVLGQLQRAGLVYKKRRGFNKSNTYRVAKVFTIERSPASYPQGQSASCHLSSDIPLHQGSVIPPKSTYLKGKGKTSFVGLEKMRKDLVEMRIIPLSKITLVGHQSRNMVEKQ